MTQKLQDELHSLLYRNSEEIAGAMPPSLERIAQALLLIAGKIDALNEAGVKTDRMIEEIDSRTSGLRTYGPHRHKADRSPYEPVGFKERGWSSGYAGGRMTSN